MKKHVFLLENAKNITVGELKKILYDNNLPDSTTLVFGTQQQTTVTLSPWDNELHFNDSRWVNHHLGKKIEKIQ